ncbi:phosphoglycerate mutase [Toxoplasma gondii ARI]|uniref:Serine/threonine-protein phosphatase PGAM5, mitochondrial n=1 Tax=Toxoplasma gondii ARI TaxID=1074872 RepID=A0A139XUV6_TOXGO|nr:phosphoglycerate mutase [Toxoplasma gondii ARI]
MSSLRNAGKGRVLSSALRVFNFLEPPERVSLLGPTRAVIPLQRASVHRLWKSSPAKSPPSLREFATSCSHVLSVKRGVCPIPQGGRPLTRGSLAPYRIAGTPLLLLQPRPSFFAFRSFVSETKVPSPTSKPSSPDETSQAAEEASSSTCEATQKAASSTEKTYEPQGQSGSDTVPHSTFRLRAGEESDPRRTDSGEQGSSDQLPPPDRGLPLLFAILTALSGVAIGLILYDAVVGETALLSGAWKFDWDGPWLQAATQREAQLAAQGVQTHPPAAVRAAEAGVHVRPPTRQIILVRHGQYANVVSTNDEEQGLTELGKLQAAITGRRLKELLKDQHVVAIWHSDMKRARETAEIIHKEAFPDRPLLQDPLLAEGVPAEPVPPSRTFKPTQEEIMVDSARIEEAFRRYFYRALPPTSPAPTAAQVAASPSADSEKQTGVTAECNVGNDSYIILVCHGNVIRYMLMRALQLPGCAWLRWATYNTGISWISIDSKGYVSCREFGDVGHLQADMITYH